MGGAQVLQGVHKEEEGYLDVSEKGDVGGLRGYSRSSELIHHLLVTLLRTHGIRILIVLLQERNFDLSNMFLISSFNLTIHLCMLLYSVSTMIMVYILSHFFERSRE